MDEMKSEQRDIASWLLLACEAARDQLKWVADEYNSTSSLQIIEVLDDAIKAAGSCGVPKIEPKSFSELSQLLKRRYGEHTP